ncbi:hypothetical protein BO86DRAFT_456305 [Aspergillus japonicus CBS 114.51]|uniref:Uncharacterized protein n=2 Tax=Aspergillus TaxID=5052 RepID=A0A2V5H8S2_ASPV1|nr:hypothetical protein BO86DRAFT_456305 [Aspergillus japonicus CBS 114.51]PYI20699.1 hypothetical protein BO99DRAFT_431400 [Aspergillus violaceofuscus CBS 115571]RAH81818.1 hypothetical protein BO86DRAFT_456305 [Aspergillus japonicus CBS 114.51]
MKFLSSILLLSGLAAAATAAAPATAPGNAHPTTLVQKPATADGAAGAAGAAGAGGSTYNHVATPNEGQKPATDGAGGDHGATTSPATNSKGNANANANANAGANANGKGNSGSSGSGSGSSSAGSTKANTGATNNSNGAGNSNSNAGSSAHNAAAAPSHQKGRRALDEEVQDLVMGLMVEVVDEGVTEVMQEGLE